MTPAPPFSSISFDVTTPEGWENARRWLVGHRRRMRLTQAAVAERMGSSRAVVSRLERGATDPLMTTLAGYMRALELAPGFTIRDATTGEVWASTVRK